MRSYGWLKTLLIFSALGPLCGSFAAALLYTNNNGYSPPIPATIVFGYIMGLIPALLSGVLFVLITKIKSADEIANYLPAALTGAIAGLISCAILTLIGGSSSLAEILIIPGLFSGSICGAVSGLFANRNLQQE